jgi:hypothetical protein
VAIPGNLARQVIEQHNGDVFAIELGPLSSVAIPNLLWWASVTPAYHKHLHQISLPLVRTAAFPFAEWLAPWEPAPESTLSARWRQIWRWLTQS